MNQYTSYRIILIGGIFTMYRIYFFKILHGANWKGEYFESDDYK